MRTLAASDPDPEAQLIAKEEGGEADEEPQPRQLPPKVLAILRGFLPPEEAYLLEAYFVRGQYQGVIAGRLGRVKQSIQYRLHRALERVRWAMTLESWDRSKLEMSRDLGHVLSEDDVRFAAILWSQKWNQSRTARVLGSTQSNTRIRILALHRTLLAKIDDEAVAPYARDLSRVIEGKAWCMGSGQVQGARAIKFPKGVRPYNRNAHPKKRRRL